jgi:hypothetical protein
MGDIGQQTAPCQRAACHTALCKTIAHIAHYAANPAAASRDAKNAQSFAKTLHVSQQRRSGAIASFPEAAHGTAVSGRPSMPSQTG